MAPLVSEENNSRAPALQRGYRPDAGETRIGVPAPGNDRRKTPSRTLYATLRPFWGAGRARETPRAAYDKISPTKRQMAKAPAVEGDALRSRLELVQAARR